MKRLIAAAAFCLAGAAVFAAPLAASVNGPVQAPGQAVVITLFWGVGCPHCEREKLFLRRIVREHPAVTVRTYEVWKNKENARLYRQVLDAAKMHQAGVPGTVIGPSVFLGFNDASEAEIEKAVDRCVREGCADAVALLAAGRFPEAETMGGTFRLPLLGAVDPSKVSLPFFTVVVAGLDSFNPCAFFVLLFLLSLLVHARSRTRMAVIGGVFVLASGVIYFLFMAAWLTVFQVIGGLGAITAAGGAVALVAGAINVKDFFLFKRGVSLMIPDSAKPKLFDRMRRLVRVESLPAMLVGTAVLAVSANAYELLCTAGFPMIYTRVLTLHGLTASQYYRYLVLYNLVYVVPLAAITAAITVTLGARKLTEWQGRQLKLLSGLMMAVLGIILIVEPALLNNVLASVVLLTGVLAVSSLIIALAKRKWPEMAQG